MLARTLVLCVCCAYSMTSGAHAQSRAARQQQPMPPASSAEGVELFRLLAEREREADASLQKGAELRRQGDARGALKAYEAAVKDYVKIYLRQTTPANPSLRPDATLQDRANYRRSLSALLSKAAESVEGYLALGGTGGGLIPEADARLGLQQLEVLRAHARLFNEADASRAVYWPNEVDSKARIISKREPAFTEEARRGRVNGTVVLRMILMADGTVGHILILKGLPAGLSEEAIYAARATRFEPAMKDGRPVAQFITVSYGFRSY